MIKIYSEIGNHNSNLQTKPLKHSKRSNHNSKKVKSNTRKNIKSKLIFIQTAKYPQRREKQTNLYVKQFERGSLKLQELNEQKTLRTQPTTYHKVKLQSGNKYKTEPFGRAEQITQVERRRAQSTNNRAELKRRYLSA